MPGDLELYGARTGNCFRVAIALEEAGLPYVVQRVDLRHGVHQAPDFLALNPAGKVPLLIDRRGSGPMLLSQSNAIMLHLAASAPDELMPVDDARGRARFHERLFYFVTDVIGPSHAGFILQASGEDGGVRILMQRSVANLQAAERFLLDSPYMLGDRFSLVDIAAVTIASAIEGDVDWAAVPTLRDWFDRVSGRPAVNRGLHAFDDD